MTMLDFSRRAELVEEMDRPDCDPGKLDKTLRRFATTNRLFTRYRTLLQRHILSDMRRDPGKAYRLTDLGAGSCDIARWLVRVCRREGLALSIRAIERDPRIARHARQANAEYPEIEIIEANACDPACWGTPDYLFAQHLLHHLPGEACVQIFQAIDKVPLRQFVISDLLRSRAAYHAYRLGVRYWSQGTFLREDGSASIRRGFREPDLRQMLDDAGMKGQIEIHSLIPGRLAIIKRQSR